jgi:hypothetical protein
MNIMICMKSLNFIIIITITTLMNITTIYYQGCGSGSGLDPDSAPCGSGSGSVLGIRIRIRIGNPDPDPGARKLGNFSGTNALYSYFLKKFYH